MIDEKCSFCDTEASGLARPMFRSGEYYGVQLFAPGLIIRFCNDHADDAEILCKISETAQYNYLISEDTLAMIEDVKNSRDKRFIHLGD